MKKIAFVFFLGLLGMTNIHAQMVGEFYRANDGHYYFKANNSQNTFGTIKVTAISYVNDVRREEYVSVRGYGDGFILGPTTPWRWYWQRGDRIYITYPDGSNVYWECPYTETKNNVSFQGKVCTGIVGCDCSGFSASSTVGNGQFICRKCNHQKKYHKK